MKDYERLRNSNSCSRPSTEIECCDNSVVTVSLLNIRSLRKHSKDVKLHSKLFNSDILPFTETQLLANDSDIEITEN